MASPAPKRFEGDDTKLLRMARSSRAGFTCLVPLLTFLLGAGISAGILVAVWGGLPAAASPEVDFSFQVLGINTTRQGGKMMNVFVKWRYRQGEDHCPFHPTNNDCIQYQKDTHSMILDVALNPTPALPLGSEWERVALTLCRNIWSEWNYLIAAVSVSVHVNGDGRSAAARGVMPYEPGAHGATCTIAPPPTAFEPISFKNALPSLGAL
eukprot:TRINITY_DN93693_c0_g1_i1.p1 TRINITY_DN93693_c0_g1~~TRINITY_DN93693_c0_g1_i1.p1  ORF type:complete len:221 (-),score=12.43 TRINITY_DN93693_c0_g1_i1:54-683(-)